MFETFFAACLGVAAPIITIYVICKLWNHIFKSKTPTIEEWRIGWRPDWQKYIWDGNLIVREATRDEWERQCSSGSPLRKDWINYSLNKKNI